MDEIFSKNIKYDLEINIDMKMEWYRFLP